MQNSSHVYSESDRPAGIYRQSQIICSSSSPLGKSNKLSPVRRQDTKRGNRPLYYCQWTGLLKKEKTIVRDMNSIIRLITAINTHDWCIQMSSWQFCIKLTQKCNVTNLNLICIVLDVHSVSMQVCSGFSSFPPKNMMLDGKMKIHAHKVEKQAYTEKVTWV